MSCILDMIWWLECVPLLILIFWKPESLDIWHYKAECQACTIFTAFGITQTVRAIILSNSAERQFLYHFWALLNNFRSQFKILWEVLVKNFKAFEIACLSVTLIFEKFRKAQTDEAKVASGFESSLVIKQKRT